ncbi:hypothetical protein G7K_3242-t1 [Saitoella complicata NRRL Y-17804]|uniref:DDE Tnp4 domain-containing protein n=1 Tax=Saitoella complicata (strain BCRC 22490 / CBS 7301 / JCM 7358 / NBRC 10748 / NRRL Y-17804) TaxID=698492 RepID=A0A0E9NGZ6_SAICN|nr:hypothetical protein G7K_3242-t1 [Saitoella complicata NRRL Y-17804]
MRLSVTRTGGSQTSVKNNCLFLNCVVAAIIRYRQSREAELPSSQPSISDHFNSLENAGTDQLDFDECSPSSASSISKASTSSMASSLSSGAYRRITDWDLFCNPWRPTIPKMKITRCLESLKTLDISLHANHWQSPDTSLKRFSTDSHFVLGLIETNPVFYNNSACEQASVRYPLACILFRFGAQSSTSSSLSKTADFIGIDNVKWPNPKKRETIAKRVKESSAGWFEGVVGVWTASASAKSSTAFRQPLFHDSTAYKDLPLHLNPDAYFSPTQYLLADSAYCNTMSVVTPFKQDQGYTTQKSGFNREVSHTRVTVEHTIGVLQTRLLQGLPMTDSEGCDAHLFRWIASCIVLAIILNLRGSADIGESWLVTIDLERHHPDDICAYFNQNGTRAHHRMRCTAVCKILDVTFPCARKSQTPYDKYP